MAEARQKAPDLVVPQTVDDLRGQLEVAQANYSAPGRCSTTLG